MSQRSLLLVLTLAGASLPARSAFAADDAPLGPVAPPRIAIGSTLGVVGTTSFKLDGHPQSGEAEDEYVGGAGGVNLSYAQGFLPYLGATVFGNCGSEHTLWAEERGERRIRCDLAVGPEVWLFPKAGKARLALHATIPFGPTWSWVHPHVPLGAKETYSTGTGWNIGLITGAEAFWGHHGVYADLGLTRHVTTYTHTSTLLADPSIHSTDHYFFEQFTFSVGVGYAYRF